MLPVKALPAAKSRLLPAVTDPEQHRVLVEAVRDDTLAAARAADGVARVLVVTDRRPDRPGRPKLPELPDLPDLLVQTRPGLNAALAEAAAHAASRWPADGVVALVGDLPALRPAELAAALAEAAGHDRSFVPDAPGTGTTMLAARPGTPLGPAFGPDSAARHAAVAVALPGGPGLRFDVDTAADLRAAAELGLGPATAAVLGCPAGFARSP
ncbi:MAG: 2-phospho-L-lactate/phosphoenolpyruvate guanylyltransferase [Pseudonocardiales bacterium]|nr:2-phospho-L-lactate/phosphoenolpyruvate guanylyltransferase [Pseudonocardiales bacterium]